MMELKGSRVGGESRLEDTARAVMERCDLLAPGEILFYPGGYSETEILFPYAGTIFASKLGRLAGNHFLTVVEGNENLRALGEMCLWEGAQDIVFEQI